MARPRSVAQVACPAHRRSEVRGGGPRRRKDGGTSQRFECKPDAGGTVHYFTVRTDATPEVLEALAAPAPPSPCHPGAPTRIGSPYGKKTPKERQRYWCEPTGQKRHQFTPVLPREHVHRDGAVCTICGEVRNPHRGETTSARKHTWNTQHVAEGLRDTATGTTYAQTSRDALKKLGVDLTKPRRRHMPKARVVTSTAATVSGTVSAAAVSSTSSAAAAFSLRVKEVPKRVDLQVTQSGDFASWAGVPVPPSAPKKGRKQPAARGFSMKLRYKAKRRSRPADESRNVWHIAADWVEAFGPVIWTPIEERLRAAAMAERARLDALIAAGQPLVRPQVWLLDDVPVYGREEETGKARRDAGFFLLVIAEVTWEDPMPSDPLLRPVPRTHLRLVRAMPKSNTVAWRLCFAEMGYQPDYVVADGGTGIKAAFDAHFTRGRTRFVPSTWHLARAVEASLLKTSGAFVTRNKVRHLISPLRDHLKTLERGVGALSSASAWSRWWKQLEDELHARQLPLDKVRYRRRNYEQDMAAVLPLLVASPEIPISTGGLEKLIEKHLEPMLHRRGAVFANIERTNRLFDLAVANAHGAFLDMNAVAEQIRADVLAHDGFTVEMRGIADPRPPKGRPRNSSLRDLTLLADLARGVGVA